MAAEAPPIDPGIPQSHPEVPSTGAHATPLASEMWAMLGETTNSRTHAIELPHAEEVTRARQKLLDSLPLGARESVEQDIGDAKIEQDRVIEKRDSQIDRLRKLAEKYNIPQEEIALEVAATEANHQQMIDAWNKPIKAAYGKAEAFASIIIDSASTGLQLRPALMWTIADSVYRPLLAENFGLTPEQDRQRVRIPLQDRVIKVGDADFFKAGNDILGHSVFDEQVLLKIAKAFKYVSREVAKKLKTKYALEKDMWTYGLAKDGDQAEEADFKDIVEGYFRPNTPGAELLQKVLDEEIYINFYRDKSGGDEFLCEEQYWLEGRTPEREKMADQLINYIFSNTVIFGKHSAAELADMPRSALAYLDEPLIDPSRTTPLEHEEKAQLEKLQAFVKPLQAYLDHSGLLYEIHRPTVHLNMGITWAGVDLATATNNYLLGLDIEGNELKGLYNEPQSFFQLDENRKPIRVDGHLVKDQARIDRFNAEARKKIEHKIQLGVITEEEEIIPERNRIMSNEIVGNALQTLYAQVERSRKRESKKALVTRALTGQSDQDIYAFAALRSGGRLSAEFRTQDRVEVLQAVYDDYGRLFNTEDFQKRVLRKKPTHRSPKETAMVILYNGVFKAKTT